MPELEVSNDVDAMLAAANNAAIRTALGLGTAATTEQVASAIAAESLSVTKRQLEDAAVDRLQTFREALSSWDGSGDGPVL